MMIVVRRLVIEHGRVSNFARGLDIRSRSISVCQWTLLSDCGRRSRDRGSWRLPKLPPLLGAAAQQAMKLGRGLLGEPDVLGQELADRRIHANPSATPGGRSTGRSGS